MAVGVAFSRIKRKRLTLFFCKNTLFLERERLLMVVIKGFVVVSLASN